MKVGKRNEKYKCIYVHSFTSMYNNESLEFGAQGSKL